MIQIPDFLSKIYNFLRRYYQVNSRIVHVRENLDSPGSNIRYPTVHLEKTIRKPDFNNCHAKADESPQSSMLAEKYFSGSIEQINRELRELREMIGALEVRIVSLTEM